MADLIIQKNISELRNEKTKEINAKEKQQHQQSEDALMYAFFQILESVNIQQGTAETEMKVLEANARDQAKLNALQGMLNFNQLTWNDQFVHMQAKGPGQMMWVDGLSQAFTPNDWAKIDHALACKTTAYITLKRTVSNEKLQKMQMDNQEIEKQRSFFSNKMLMDQQGAQIEETGLNSVTNRQEQGTQILGAIMDMMKSLTTQILRR